ncbi:MAG: hypothetical protein CMK65_07320 [Pseudoalteromonas sp.]|uniref:hypothetical protein n=1 Tax=Pseudoalteromonas sp. TaxID=53249 RepID=UPI000C95DE06|nr:hypothetical protein [Pseudoalteromonas sp.]MAD03413.1 hypothetical protein [Pseudoalteromonas sp.]|tara:strand:- start:18010 stop:19371 length:1362 start_codon:yes stop_codon:yes gene_type:complete
MNRKTFQLFASILRKSSPSISDGELKVPLPSEAKASQIVEDTLKDVGYSFDDVRTIRQNYVNISLSAASWSGTCPIHKSWDDLFSIVENTSKLPSYFYVLETNQSSFDNTQNKRALELFCQLRQLLASLADQCEPPQEGCAKGSRKLFYIIETDDGVTKYDFKPTLKWSELKEVPTENGQLSLVEKLRKLISLGDSQDSERRSVMRSAFHEIISACHSNSEIFKKILDSIDNFHKRYEEHHDLFVRRFSINKVLHEINEKDLTYTSKINEILSSAQNKALTIPGALIVIGAVMKIDQVVDGIAVAIGMFITTVIVHRSLDVHNSTFKHIEKQVTAEFKQYDVLNEKVEIRQRAQQTITELSDLLDKAKKNSSFMKNSIWFICFLAVVFISILLKRVDENGDHAQATQQSINTAAPENNELQADNIAPISKATISKPVSAANSSASNAPQKTPH